MAPRNSINALSTSSYLTQSRFNSTGKRGRHRIEKTEGGREGGRRGDGRREAGRERVGHSKAAEGDRVHHERGGMMSGHQFAVGCEHFRP